MGGRAHDLDLARPFALDGVRVARCTESKLERALVVAFALAEVLVQGGERVGMPGPDAADRQPQRDRKMAEAIVHDPAERAEPAAGFRAGAARPKSLCCPTCGARSPKSARIIANLSANGAHGHVVQIVDPAEETFPIPAASSSSSRKAPAASPPAAPRTGATTTGPLARHRAEIRAETERLGWSFTIHRTDRPANELLMALHARMGATRSTPSLTAGTRRRSAGRPA